MYNSTTDVYITKRETVNLSKSLIPKEKQVESTGRRYLESVSAGAAASSTARTAG